MPRTVTYSVYSEAGGVGKTTLTANLAKAHERAGEDVLAIDMDPQEGSLSYLMGVNDERYDDVDNLVRHMINRPKGPLEDVIRTSEGIDVLPSHAMLEELGDNLSTRADEVAADPDINENEWMPEAQLHRALAQSGVAAEYDVIIIDPPATAGQHLYNAIYATRSLVLPVELSGKGRQSVKGLDLLVDGLEDTLNIDVGVLAVVPNGGKGTSDQENYREYIEGLGYECPISIGDRESLMQGMWDQQCSAFTYVDEHRSRRRDYEVETLEQIEELAAFLIDYVRTEATV